MTKPRDVLAEAIGSVELGFWRETPIEDPDGVHGIEARFDVRAFAEAITAALDARGYALVRTPETLPVNGVPVRRRYDLTKDSDPAHDFDGPDPFAASPPEPAKLPAGHPDTWPGGTMHMAAPDPGAELREALAAFFEDIDADWSNDNIRPGDFAFRFRAAADRLRAALVRTPETDPLAHRVGLPPGPYRVEWPAEQGGAFTLWGRQGTPPDFKDGWAIPLVASGVDVAMYAICDLLNAALVRTPETLDVERLQPRREREHREKDATGEHWWRCIPISEAYLLIATPSPTPPEGLRAAAQRVVAEWDALMLAAIEDGEQGVLFPDATVNLADAILPLRAALAPSAEPPETADE